jgi:hypothetical protein
MALFFRDGLRIGSLIIFGSILGIFSGCGPSTAPVVDSRDKTERIQENTLTQLGDVLRLRQEDSSSPPAKLTDLEKYARAFPLACSKAKSGDVVLFFGAALREGVDDTILAYGNQVPVSGGYVLMQDGKTIKKLTADEFKSAKKASKGS